MASSSTSSIQKIFKYDVFLSFRGEDTRNSFLGHLYDALKRKSIQTYKDDEEINKGNKISDELIKSIEDSKFYIIVFSKNYASSSWCLNELLKIMKCRKEEDRKAYPVFYDVEPTEVRYQTGAVGKAFAKHENEESAGKWRGALKEAADLAGWDLKTTFNGHEAKLIKKIVEEISLDIRPIWSGTDGKLVGMKTRVQKVVSSLKIGYDDVRMIGIKGIGGGGKTTLARAVFDNISAGFEGQSFVENVREVSKATLYGLKSLQKQILSDVLNDQRITVNSVFDGKNMMKRMMISRKVLVVLDDVDHIDQLDALAGEPNWFKSGSRIIITTRDEQVLAAHRVNLTLDVNLLSDKEAICLFSRYAFGKENPIEGYEELSTRVVHYAAGLPLTMRVLGSNLCGKDNLEWIDALDRLKEIPLKETLQKLEISYIALEDDYKEIFLDVACFHKGSDKVKAIKTLESQGFHARNGLRVLEQKSLITISYNKLNMHDHIEEMGKNIVRREHPREPWEHSRLWIEAEIKKILANDQGTEATRGIQIRTLEPCPETYTRGLRKMKKLRFLDVRCKFDGYHEWCDRSSWKFDTCGQYLPNSLEYLRWDWLPIEGLPITLLANNLVTLKMRHSNIVRLLEQGEKKALDNLRFLDLSFSELITFDFELTPNLKSLNLSYNIELTNLTFGSTPNLESLSLQGCNLVELHMPIECPNLKFLNLDDNSMLRNLTLGSSPNLEELSLKGCEDLVELHMPYRYPKLNFINLTYSKLKTLELGLISDLETSSLERCDLVECHKQIECPNLEYLNLDNNSMLRNLTLGSIPNLEWLSLEGCGDLVELHMPYRYPKLNAIYLKCAKLKTLELGLISDLETSSLTRCDSVELPKAIEFPNLKYLKLDSNSMLRNLTLGSTPNLEELSLEGCVDLVELHMPFRYPNLKTFNLTCSKLKTLELGLISDLETSSLTRCDSVELHKAIEFPNLKYLKLDNNSMLRNLTLGSTPNLEELSLEGCGDLVELHMPYRYPKLNAIYLTCAKLKTLELGLISDLETSSLTRCDSVELHKAIEFPNLKYLKLDNNSMLRNLTLGSTPNLKELSLKGCGDLVELHMPFRYPNLKTFNLTYSKLTTLELGLISDLETSSLERCDLVEHHMPIECPNLEYLNLDDNSMLRNLTLGSTPILEELSVKGCVNLVELHMPYRYPNLNSIYLTSSKLKTLELGLISNLETTSLVRCDSVKLHKAIECPNLKYLTLDDNSMLRKLTIGSTPNLKQLSLEGCVNLVELQMPYTYSNLNSIYLTSSKLKTLELGLISNLETSSLERCDSVELHKAIECPNLEYLKLHNNSMLRNLTLGSIPNLEGLSLKGCGDLVELHMPFRYPNLKTFNLTYSKLTTLELGLTSDLETSSLERCDLVEHHMPIECPNLEYLNLDDNSMLRNLTLGSTPNLKELSLKGCGDLVELHMPFRYPNLKTFNLTYSKLTTLELGLISDLETSSLTRCDSVELHKAIGFPNLKYLKLDNNSMLRNLTLGSTPNLEQLSLKGCGDLVELHMPFRYPNLYFINLTCSKLKTLELGLISDLKTSSLERCDSVEHHKAIECPNLTYLKLDNNSMLRNLTLGSTPNLEELSLNGCGDLVELHMPFRYPNLYFINLTCSKLKTLELGLISDLETSSLTRCDSVELPKAIEFPNLKYLKLDSNSMLRNLTLGSTPNLEQLSLKGCGDLVELHMPFRYRNLKTFNVTYSKLTTLELGLISDLETSSLERCDSVELHKAIECPNLTYLNLDNNSMLRNLTLGSTSNLESLSLKGCDLLELHMPIECPNLEYLNLDNNSMLRKLTIGLTPNLEQLSLEGCGDLLELHMPYTYSNLKTFNLTCSKLKTLELRLISGLETSSLTRGDSVELHQAIEFPNLKYLKLDNNSMLRNLTLGSTPSLEELSLEGCGDLVELHMPYRYPKLNAIYLTCSKLKTLELGLISDLETSSLQGCNLVELHMPIECPNLKFLNLDDNSMLRNLTLGSTPNLEELSLEGCNDLVELHMPFSYPKLILIYLTCSKLKTLELGLISDIETSSLERCDLVECHKQIECPNLEYLKLDNNSMLRNLTLGSTPSLEELSLEGCGDLVELHMPYRYPNLKTINLTYSKLTTLELGLISDLETSSLERCDSVEHHKAIECPNLTYLKLDNNSMLRNLTLGSTPNLVELSLNGCGDLVELHMPFRYPYLKTINLTYSKLTTLELGLNLDLETSSLERCDLVEHHMPIECPNLEYLNLDNNSMLRKLTVGSTPNLEVLSLEGCVDFVELHMPFRYPKLISIYLTCSKLKTLELGLILNLERLNLERCDLVERHMPIECPNLEYLMLDNNSMLRKLTLGSTPNLEELGLEGCVDLVELHMPFRYPKLNSIYLTGSKLKTLELGLILDLERLSLERCDLVERHMPIECPNLEYLKLDNNSMLRKLTVGSTPNLEVLSLKGCVDSVELHMPFRYPKLISIYLTCSKLKTLELGLILNLERLNLERCDLVERHMPIECPNLEYLMLDNNSMLRKLTVGSTPNLEELGLEGCVDLVELHMPFRYPKLNSIYLTGSKLKTLELGLILDLERLSLERCDLVERHMPIECPNLEFLILDNNSMLRNLTLGSTPNLEELSLEGCGDLVELHMPYRYPKLNAIYLTCSKLKTLELGLISDLETSSLQGCNLVELHMPIECPNLKFLNLDDNSMLRNLTLGSTPNLEELSLKGCVDLVELHMPFRYAKLNSIHLTCSKLKTLVLGLILDLETSSVERCDSVGLHKAIECPNLKYLKLDNNSMLRNLTLGSTLNLEELSLVGCVDLVELHMPYR